jgi:hypothetical protein
MNQNKCVENFPIGSKSYTIPMQIIRVKGALHQICSRYILVRRFAYLEKKSSVN